MNHRMRMGCLLVLLVVGTAGIGVPSPAAADGLIIVDDPPRPLPGHFAFAPLSVSYHHVTVAVNGQVAQTTVDQEFYNPNPERLEGTYVFPLPQGAHIDRFSMEVNGKLTEAELLPADKARTIYEDIVRRLKDPALLEYAGRGAFRLRIYPIEPRSGKRIRIRYTQLLTRDAGITEYTYPLATEKFSSSPVRDVSVRVTIDEAQPLKAIYCPTHPAEIRREGDRHAVVGWEGRDVWPDSDFKVIFSRSPDPLGIELVASRQSGEDGYFMLVASPGLLPTVGADRDVGVQPKTGTSGAGADRDVGVQPKDVCFVLDTSGSMAGPKLQQAKKALQFCLASLVASDRFEIIRFSTEAEPLFGHLVAADAAHLARARTFVEQLQPMGGTAIEEALDQALALRPPGSGEGRPYLVTFLTDGIPTVGETREEALVDSLRTASRSTRIFTFGLGTDVNTHLLDRIASQSRAVSQYVLPQEDIEVSVSSFFSKVRNPVLSNLSLSFRNPSIRISRRMPSELPDLFNGEQLVVFGRYSGSGATSVTISGTVNGNPRRFTADLLFPERTPTDDPLSSFVPRLWAARRVGWLLDEIRMHGDSQELRDEVVRLARSFGIVTPYTAYLVLEDEERRGVAPSLRSFQEMEEDRDAVSQAKSRLDSVRREAASEASRAGASAVENSLALKDLMSATNLPPAAPAPGLQKTSSPAGAAQGYRAAQAMNYGQQVRVVAGRAFYQNGPVWTDSTAQAHKGLRQRQVRFGSPEYFELTRTSPDAAQWFSLGANVDVVLGGVLVIVRE